MINGVMTILGLLLWFGAAVGLGSYLNEVVRLRGLPTSVRMAFSVALSPPLAVGLVYLFRGFGLEFQTAARLAGGLGLIGIGLLFRGRSQPEAADRSGSGVLLVAAIPILALVIPPIVEPEKRLYWSHSWMHTDIVYQIANGPVRPEDPQLAGVPLGYPWLGPAHQGVLSAILDGPPNANYLLTNLAFLAAIAVLLGALIRALGGGGRAVVAGTIGLFLALNFLGYFMSLVIDPYYLRRGPIAGDWRYTPWLWTFRFLNEMEYALAPFTALAFLFVRSFAKDASIGAPAVFVLVLTAGLFYPMLLPAVAVLGGAALLVGCRPYGGERPWSKRTAVTVVLALVLGAIPAALYLKIVTTARVAPGAEIGAWKYTVAKTIGAVAALAVYLIAWLAERRARKADLSPGLRMLEVAAAGGFLVMIAIHLPNFRNEYKFMFTEAIALSPFFGLAIERRLAGRRHPFVALLLIALCLSIPLASKIFRRTGGESDPAAASRTPPLDIGDFSLDFEAGVELGDLCRAVREATPKDTIVVIRDLSLNLSAVTQRAFFVAVNEAPIPGLNLNYDDLLDRIRGYDTRLTAERRAALRALYDSGGDPAAMQAAFAKIAALARPVAIFTGPADRHFAAALDAGAFGSARLLVDRPSGSVRLILPASR